MNKTLIGEVTGFHGSYVVVKVPNAPAPHLAEHYVAPREFRGTRAIGQRVKLVYVSTRASSLWYAADLGGSDGS